MFGVLKPLGDFGAAVATGALLAAAVYGGCKAFEGISSRALEQGGPASKEPPGEWQGEIPENLKDIRNPTGGGIRPRDRWGSGYYGAQRDGGARYHIGTDLLGEEFGLPFEGSTHLLGQGYSRGMLIMDPNGAFRVLLIHVDPQTMMTLDPTHFGFPGMGRHLHFQLEQNLGGYWRHVNPEPFLYPHAR